MWIGNHTNRHNIGFAWLPILRYVDIFHTRHCTTVITPKTHFSLFSYKLNLFQVLYEIWMFINSHTVHIHDYQFSFYGKVTGNFKKPLFIFSLSMSNWPYISNVDIICGFSIPFWTFKGMVDILKNRGWNIMGIAHYAIRLVSLYYQYYYYCGVFWLNIRVNVNKANRVMGDAH